VPARPELDAEQILRRLTARGVDFVVIGGLAAVLWGSPRMTFDLDISFALDDGNLDALGDVLIELMATLKGIDEPVPFVPDPRTLRRVELLTLNTSAGELDLLAHPPGTPGYETLRKNAARVDVGDFHVLIASVEDLILMKRAAARAKDLADIEELEAIRRLGGGRP
jgi:predicted nucleotidyltransferase